MTMLEEEQSGIISDRVAQKFKFPKSCTRILSMNEDVYLFLPVRRAKQKIDNKSHDPCFYFHTPSHSLCERVQLLAF